MMAKADGTEARTDAARILGANDVISITVYHEDDLAVKSAIVDKNGMVMVPLLGQVKLSGMTVQDATTEIQQRYKKGYLVNPQVNLVVEKVAENHFAVLGQVQRPGNFEFPQDGKLDLLKAIAMAEGYTRLGAPAKVTVRRIENGVPQSYPLDAEKMAKDPSKAPFPILPGDTIIVGERNF